MSLVQTDASGRLRHLITLQGLGHPQVTALLDRAVALREAFGPSGNRPRLLESRTVVNLFFEPSTRTRSSFELAARRLGADVLNFDVAGSSTSKGETLEDTVATLESMQADAFIVRHRENGTPQRLAAFAQHAAILNAGDGNHAHPTQGLLDALTIRDRHPDMSRLKVVICGDIRHSRVARSDTHVLKALGVEEIRLCGPAPLMPDAGDFQDCPRTDNFDEAIEGCHVVMMLRLQKERMVAGLAGSEAEYFRNFGLTESRLSRAAKGAMVMHPGPMNRGVEIAPEVADGPQSCVLRQVANGISVRMAVLAALLEG